jgi:hypothetical protein
VKNSQYEGAVFERLEDNQVISVRADPYRISQIRACDIVMRSVGDFLAVLPYFADERDSAQRIVERDVIADLLQVNFGLGCEMREYSLRAVFGNLRVLLLQTVKYLSSGFGFAAAAALFDFTT